MPNTESVSLVEQISNATAEDLQQIDTEVAELEKQQQTLQNKIDALKKVRRVVDIAINGKPQRKPRGSGKKGSGDTQVASNSPKLPLEQPTAAQSPPDATPSPLEQKLITAIEKYGPQTAATLATKCGVGPASVNHCIDNSQLFTRLNSGTVKLKGMS